MSRKSCSCCGKIMEQSDMSRCDNCGSHMCRSCYNKYDGMCSDCRDSMDEYDY